MAFDDGSNTWPSGAFDPVAKTYGPRSAGGDTGPTKTEGAYNEVVINFDATASSDAYIPAGAFVVDVDETFSTGAVTVATVGGTDVSAATEAVPVEASGVVVITGPTAGSVIVKYKRIA